MLAAFATSFRSPFPILRETARAVLPAFAASLSRPLPVIGKVAGAMLPPNLSCPRRFFAILCKVARIAGMIVGHHVSCFGGSVTGHMTHRVLNDVIAQRVHFTKIVMPSRS